MTERNGYQCEKCGHIILTKQVSQGVTPFMVPCQIAPCTGNMQSWFHQIHPAFGHPTHQWIDRGGECLTLERITPFAPEDHATKAARIEKFKSGKSA